MPRIRLLPPIRVSIRAAWAWSRRAWGNLGHRNRHWFVGTLAAIRAAWVWSRGVWSHVGHRNRHWVINVLIGVVIESGLHYAHEWPTVVAAQNWALDAAMRGSAAVHELYGGEVASLPLAFIDVDEETWRSQKWGKGEPLSAPRDGLLNLIDYAIEHKARYIVLDVIIEGNSDAWFAGEIEKRVTFRMEPYQHILFVRTLREPLNGMQGLLAPELRPSLSLDEVIKKHPEQLLLGSPYFQVSRDGVLRDWQMWRYGCRRDTRTGEGHWKILPSAQLLIAALIHSEDERWNDKQRDDYRKSLPWNKPDATELCIVDLAAYPPPDVPRPKVRPDDAWVWAWLRNSSGLLHASEVEKLKDEAVALSNRIWFRFRYRQEASGVQLVPALAILNHTLHRDIAENGVVFIGQSFEDARDEHATPLGTMPGPMVLINSLDSILKPGLLHAPSPTWEFLIKAASILLVGGVLAYFDYFITAVVMLLPFVIVLIFLNYWLMLDGLWLDFSIPLLGMYVHRVFAEFEAYLPRRRRLRSAHAETHVDPKGGD